MYITSLVSGVVIAIVEFGILGFGFGQVGKVELSADYLGRFVFSMLVR